MIGLCYIALLYLNSTKQLLGLRPLQEGVGGVVLKTLKETRSSF